MVIDHRDGDESNGAPSNLRWLCKSCNTRLGAQMARQGKGVRTRQYNPGAENLAQYTIAVTEHQRGAHDAAGRVIHETPKEKRREFAREIWNRRRTHGTDRRIPEWARENPSLIGELLSGEIEGQIADEISNKGRRKR